MLRFATKLLLTIFVAATVAAAQSAPPQKSIPAIAKAANGAVVSIVMSDKNGNPIAQGSGFIVSTDGLIVTNYHVIAEGTSAVVKLPDGAFYLVDGVLASDKARDIAVIKAHGEHFRTLVLGDSDRIQVGQEVVAIGNPLSLESTVSNGIVSSVRSIDEKGGKYLQITAPISPGSSGGPLFNMEGQVIGVTTMYLKGGENLNFAIPINDAKPLLETHSAKLQNFPNQSEPVEEQTQNRDEDVPASSGKSTQPEATPTPKTAVAFMQQMVEPEDRQVLLGTISGVEMQSPAPIITIVSDQPVYMIVPTGETHKDGYPESTYTVGLDTAGPSDGKDYPAYISFALGDIDPLSIQSWESGNDGDAIIEFLNKHPKCEADPQCDHDYLAFLDSSAHKLTAVSFHTTDLKPLIERGGLEFKNCPKNPCAANPVPDGTTGRVMIFFRNKDRAERFVTALTYAVKSAGGKPDLFPPTP